MALPASRSGFLLVVGLVAACSESSGATQAAPPVVKCSVEPNVRCDCDTRDSPSGMETACSPATLGEPALCCSDEAFAKDENGGCSCVALTCEHVTVDGGKTCRCGAVSAVNAERVAACAPQAGEQCCVDAKKRLCTCGGTTCDGTVVPDCSLERIERSCAAQFTTYRSAVGSCRD